MKKTAFYATVSTLLAVFTLAAAAPIAEWDFARPDAAAGKFPLKMRGETKIDNAKLTVLNADPTKPAGAATAEIHPELTPAKAFTLSVTFELDGTFRRSAKSNAMLWDSKYVTAPDDAQKKFHNGFQLFLEPMRPQPDQFRIAAAFGYGDKSARARSGVVTIAPDRVHTVDMLFTATGKVEFTLDGVPAGSAALPTGAVAAAERGVVLGDRHGSYFWPLGGRISKVVLREAEYQPLSAGVDPAKRRAFERGEKSIEVFVRIFNAAAVPSGKLTVSAKLGDQELKNTVIDQLGADSSQSVGFALSPWLLPGKYTLDVTVHDAAGRIAAQSPVEFIIAPAYGDFMPVVLWGGASRREVKDLGFTHQVVGTVPTQGTFTEAMLPKHLAALDGLLEYGLYGYSPIHGNYRFVKPGRFLRTGRDGKPYARVGLEVSNPEVRKEFAEVVEATAKALGDHPAWDMALSNSEARDASNISFGGVEPANFKKYSGYDIPSTVDGKYPVGYASTAGFPWDRIVKDDAPELTFFRWFWKEGDGWNDLHTLISETLHKHIKHHFTTFYDPVTRVPPTWGSGGKVDAVSQWTYTNPDPIKIGQATDEVIAMAQGRPGQKVMTMTQAIWYRSQVAPQNVKVENPPEWIAREPEAKFITIPPDALQEALWSKLSRRVDGIMYHGSGSLIQPEKHSYRYTNPHSKAVLKKLSESVLKPLGPVLTKVPEREPEIAILESFPANLYAPQHFPLGWSNKWAADLHLALQWAHFQPAILFDEHLLNDLGTGQLKVLFVPGAEVLSEKVLAQIQALQKKGVIIVGDEFTTPALMVDLRLQSVKRVAKDPAGSKKALQQLGAEIAAALADHYQSPMQASNADLVVRRRGTADADYVFVVNDKRTFGDYLGQWKLVMEKGLPNEGSVAVDFPAAAAYDLVAHRRIPLRKQGKSMAFDTKLGPGAGQLVLLLKQPIEKVDVQTPAQTVKRGEKYYLKIRILNTSGQPVPAILPVEVTLTGADGTPLPGSGYYAARDGRLTIEEVAAPNMKPGLVTVKALCLSSGQGTTAKFAVAP